MDTTSSSVELAVDFDSSPVDDVIRCDVDYVTEPYKSTTTTTNNNNNSSSSSNSNNSESFPVPVEKVELEFIVADSDDDIVKKKSNSSLPGSRRSSGSSGSSGSAAGKTSSVGDSDSVRTATPVDPWDLIEEYVDTGPKWSELSVLRKIWSVIWVFVRICLVLGLLYLFVCSLDILTDSFQLLSGRTAGEIFTNSLITNPVCGLMIGVFVTVLVQSSSTSTSIVVSMVGSGIIDVQTAIPIIMGANIGTTVTNTLVALTQSPDRNVFRRAFAGATVHDMFNWLTVMILLPIEVLTGYLFYMTEAMTQNVGTDSAGEQAPQFLKVITEPLTTLIVQVDKKVITAVAEGSDRQKFPLVKYYCDEVSENYTMWFIDEPFNETAYDVVNNQIFTYDVLKVNETDYSLLTWIEVLDLNSTKCKHIFVGSGLPGSALSEQAVGGICLAGSLICMTACLMIMVKILNTLLQGPVRKYIRKYINADFPGYAAFLTGYVAMLIGAGITFLVQSSSVFTSTLTPLVGIGVVTVERVYPLTLGSNIGTTVTSIIAAMTADADMIRYTLQISLCHLFFNITGIIIWYPIPFMRHVPIRLAKKLGNTTGKYRWFAIVYLIGLFFVMPLVVFGLSVAGWYVLLAVALPVIILVVFVVVVSSLQTRRPNWLPTVLRSWDFLPLPLHSLQPYDRALTICCNSAAITRCRVCCSQHCKCCKCCRVEDDDGVDGAEQPETVVVESNSRRSSCKSLEDDERWTSVTKFNGEISTSTKRCTDVVGPKDNHSFAGSEANSETSSFTNL